MDVCKKKWNTGAFTAQSRSSKLREAPPEQCSDWFLEQWCRGEWPSLSTAPDQYVLQAEMLRPSPPTSNLRCIIRAAAAANMHFFLRPRFCCWKVTPEMWIWYFRMQYDLVFTRGLTFASRVRLRSVVWFPPLNVLYKLVFFIYLFVFGVFFSRLIIFWVLVSYWRNSLDQKLCKFPQILRRPLLLACRESTDVVEHHSLLLKPAVFACISSQPFSCKEHPIWYTLVWDTPVTCVPRSLLWSTSSNISYSQNENVRGRSSSFLSDYLLQPSSVCSWPPTHEFPTCPFAKQRQRNPVFLAKYVMDVSIGFLSLL